MISQSEVLYLQIDRSKWSVILTYWSKLIALLTYYGIIIRGVPIFVGTTIRIISNHDVNVWKPYPRYYIHETVKSWSSMKIGPHECNDPTVLMKVKCCTYILINLKYCTYILIKWCVMVTSPDVVSWEMSPIPVALVWCINTQNFLIVNICSAKYAFLFCSRFNQCLLNQFDT